MQGTAVTAVLAFLLFLSPWNLPPFEGRGSVSKPSSHGSFLPCPDTDTALQINLLLLISGSQALAELWCPSLCAPPPTLLDTAPHPPPPPAEQPSPLFAQVHFFLFTFFAPSLCFPLLHSCQFMLFPLALTPYRLGLSTQSQSVLSPFPL